MDVLIKDLPDEVHAQLARRAEARDMSLRAYLRATLTEHVALPSIDDWLDRLRELGTVDSHGLTGAALVSEARAEDQERLSR